MAARLLMATLVPAPGLLHLRIWTNASAVVHPSMPLVHAVSILAPALLSAAIGFRFAGA